MDSGIIFLFQLGLKRASFGIRVIYLPPGEFCISLTDHSEADNDEADVGLHHAEAERPIGSPAGE